MFPQHAVQFVVFCAWYKSFPATHSTWSELQKSEFASGDLIEIAEWDEFSLVRFVCEALIAHSRRGSAMN